VYINTGYSLDLILSRFTEQNRNILLETGLQVHKRPNIVLKFKIDSLVSKGIKNYSNCLPNSVIFDIVKSDYNLINETFIRDQYLIHLKPILVEGIVDKNLIHLKGADHSIKRLFGSIIL
jgi:hypothetical protein